MLVGFGVLALVVWPTAVSIYFAVASFSGCFLECSQPEPAVGVLWAAIAVFLLVIPVAAGLITARVHSARGWLIAFLAIAAVLAVWRLSQSVI